jgi:hypothetical protein
MNSALCTQRMRLADMRVKEESSVVPFDWLCGRPARNAIIDGRQGLNPPSKHKFRFLAKQSSIESAAAQCEGCPMWGSVGRPDHTGPSATDPSATSVPRQQLL